MKGDIEIRLERGIEAAQAGEWKRARAFFVQVIQLDQYNEQAWLQLGSVVDTIVDEHVCLENVLFINPNNKQAAVELERISRQRSLAYLASPPTLPSLAKSQAQKAWEKQDAEDEWKWARKLDRDGATKWEWDVSSTTDPSSPVGRVCPRCDYRNANWAYVCGRCGANLRPIDLQAAISSSAKPRGRNPFTLLAAWGGVFAFNPGFAFLPEVELASWSRSLAALLSAAIFASVWRAITAAVPEWTVRAFRLWRTIGAATLRGTVETLPSALLTLALAGTLVVLATWMVARLAGGKQIFRIHAHLTVVAFSTWFILVALLSPFIPFIPYLLDRASGVYQPFELLPTLVGGVVGFAGLVWSWQALQTAYRLPVVRTILAALLVSAVFAGLGFGLGLRSVVRLVEFLNVLALPFLPWSG